MATAVPSRFAVLSIDDDDYKPKRSQKPPSSGKSNPKSANKNDKQKQQPNKKDEKKKPSKVGRTIIIVIICYLVSSQSTPSATIRPAREYLNRDSSLSSVFHSSLLLLSEIEYKNDIIFARERL